MADYTKYTNKEMQAITLAQQITDDNIAIVGTGLPLIGASLAKRVVCPSCHPIVESGLMDFVNKYLVPAPDHPYDVLEPAFSLTVSCVVSGQSDTASFPLVSVLLRKTAFPDDEAVWLLPETRTDPDMHPDVPAKNWHTDFLVLPMLSDIPLPFPDHEKYLCHRDITCPTHTEHTGFLFPLTG